MAKADILSRLINTLTKAEKRYFRLYSSLQQGSKDYVHLFNLLEQQTFSSASAAREAFHRQYPRASYAISSKYLYKVLLDCLLHLRMQQQQHTTALATGILKSEILLERSLHEEGIKQLQKTRQLALNSGKQLFALWAMQREMQQLHLLNFPDMTEDELLRQQAAISTLATAIQDGHRHTVLYEQLRHHLLYKGAARTVAQQETAEQLAAAAQQLAIQTQAVTPVISSTRLLFRAHYFLVTGDHNSALQVFYELHTLQQRHAQLFDDTPADQLLVIEGILDSLRATRKYPAFRLFLDKVKQLKSDAPYFDIMLQRLAFIYELRICIDSGNFTTAKLLLLQHGPGLAHNALLPDIGKQAEMQLYQAIVYLGNEDINNAHQCLENILQQSSIYSVLPVYRTCRLVHLLIQYELGNYEYIRYETRAFRRQFQPGAKRAYLLERTVIKFLAAGAPSPVAAYHSTLGKKMRTAFEKIRADKYETQMLRLFDFTAWIEAKLKKRPLAEILKEKYEKDA